MLALDSLLRVTLVGRPNVGKSTIFNRIVGKHVAITATEAGTTRDRIERPVTLGRGASFILADVGGIETGGGGTLDADIQAQVRHAVTHSDLILFIVDARAPLTADDLAAADLLRRARKTVIFVANKWESGDFTELMVLTELGFGLPLGISAGHYIGFDELKEAITKALRKLRRETAASTAIPDVHVDARVAIIGRPNVGKSSLLNKLVGEERVIVSEVPCTTRDTNDVLLERAGKTFQLLDTAGMRRAGKIGTGIDRFATGRTLNAISEADVALLLVDGAEGITAQDLHVAEKAIEAGVGLIIVVNKIDLWQMEYEEALDRWVDGLSQRFHFASYLPVVMISAKTGKNVEHLFDEILEVKTEREKRAPTHELNILVKRALAEHQPGRKGFRSQPRVYYVTQAETAPPTFVFFVNVARAFHFSYRRYLENRIRDVYGFRGTPVRIQFKEKVRTPKPEGERRDIRVPTRRRRD